MNRQALLFATILLSVSSVMGRQFNPTKGYEGSSEQVANQIVNEMKDGKRKSWGVSVRHKDWNKEIKSLERSRDKAAQRGDFDAVAIIDRKIDRRYGFLSDKQSNREDSVQRVMQGALDEKRDEEAFYRARGMNDVADRIATDIRTLEVDREVSKKWKQHIDEKSEAAEIERAESKKRRQAEWDAWKKESAKRMEEIRKGWAKESAKMQKLSDKEFEERVRKSREAAQAYTNRIKKKQLHKNRANASKIPRRNSLSSQSARNMGKAKFNGYTYGNRDGSLLSDKRAFGQDRTFGQDRKFGQDRDFGQNKRFGSSSRFGQTKTFGQNRSFGKTSRFGKSFKSRPRGLSIRR